MKDEKAVLSKIYQTADGIGCKIDEILAIINRASDSSIREFISFSPSTYFDNEDDPLQDKQKK